MAGDHRQGLARLGERLAVQALEQAGLRILARNWRCPLGEIDIVGREGDVLVVVEVKTRRGRQAGTPEQGVDEPKRAQLCALAQAYSEHIGWEGAVRIDVVGVELDARGHLLRVSHWREAVDCW
ncbi:MAG: YraN family protein [Anaerolineae bacterium]|nr:YraN family protein [Caldilineales bacterium]MCX7852859.1 YraN family protein [Caldilineales bacterium]MDW8268747.1 YraN family protein [Anaerolineae bacterium]